MGTEDKYLVERFGKNRPFKVPEGYFESIASQVMDKLPDREVRIARTSAYVLEKNRCVLLYAACFLAALFSISIYLGNTSSDNNALCEQTATAGVSYADNVMDCVADYSMMDNEDIYALVSEN